jgi:hypothetical protein
MSSSKNKVGNGRNGMPPTLFGELIKCPHCGGGMVVVNSRLYGCTARKDRGSAICRGFTLPRKLADERLLTVLRNDLLSPQDGQIWAMGSGRISQLAGRTDALLLRPCQPTEHHCQSSFSKGALDSLGHQPADVWR